MEMTLRKIKGPIFKQHMLIWLLCMPLCCFGSPEQPEKRSWLSKIRTRITKLVPAQENLPFKKISGLYAYMGFLALYKAYQETSHSVLGAADGRTMSPRTLFAYWSLGGTYTWLASQAFARALEQEEDDDDDYEDYWDTYRRGDEAYNSREEIQYRKLSKKGRLKALGKAATSLGFIWLISPITRELCSIIATQTHKMVCRPSLDQLAIPLISIPALIGQCILYARCLRFSYAKLKEVKTGEAVITEEDDDDEDYYV